jgi:hypothetical protein
MAIARFHVFGDLISQYPAGTHGLKQNRLSGKKFGGH